jgi:hypothetical protein
MEESILSSVAEHYIFQQTLNLATFLEPIFFFFGGGGIGA